MKLKKLLLEGLLDISKQMVSLNFGPLQKKFFQWKLKKSKIIKVESYKSNPEIKQKVEAFLKTYKPKLKGCYDTAYRLTNFDTDFLYVEGEIGFHGIPIDHAWNKYKDVYIDITAEVLFNGKMGDEYMKIIELDYLKLNQCALKSGVTGPQLGYAYENHF